MTQQREPGSYIGQHPDENTDQVREGLGADDERVAVSNTRSSGEGGSDTRVQGRDDETPGGHREGPPASDDEVRRAGESG